MIGGGTVLVITLALAVYAIGIGAMCALLEGRGVTDELFVIAVALWPAIAPGLAAYVAVRCVLDRQAEPRLPKATARQAEDLMGQPR